MLEVVGENEGEEFVVSLVEKDIVLIGTAVEDVIVMAWLKLTEIILAGHLFYISGLQAYVSRFIYRFRTYIWD